MRDTATSRNIIARLNDITRPSPSPTPSALATAARAATVIWLVASAINFLVWLLVCMFSGSVDSPWWLWAFAGGGAVVGILHLAARSCRTYSRDAVERTANGDDW